MAGRDATVNVIPGDYALSVGRAEMETPTGWAWTSLLEIARLESGHTPSREHASYWNGDVPWLGIPDAREHHGGRIESTRQTITEEGLANSAARWLPKGTVCLSRTASVGYVTILDRPMATSQDFVNWICTEAVDPEFLMRLFLAEKQALLRFSKGTTHRTIYYPEVKAFHVCLPPRNEQRRIVTKLDALTAKSRRAKEALDAIPPLLERFRQSVLAAAFRGDLTADWRAAHPDVEPAEKLLERIRAERRKRWEEAELAKMRAKGKTPKDDSWKAKYKQPEGHAGAPPWSLPSSWTWTSIDEVSDILLGRQRAPQYLTGRWYRPYLRVANVFERGLDLTNLNEMDFDEADYDKYRLVPGDVLMSEGQTPELVGESAIYDGSIDGLCFQKTLHRMRPISHGPSSRYLQQGFMCLRRSDVFRRFASLTTSIAHLTLNRVRVVPFPLAPAEEQMIVVDRVAKAFGAADLVEQNVRVLYDKTSKFDRAILAKAFRGELVPQDPNDEPASVLLERIRAERAAASGAPTKKTRGRPKKQEVG